MAVLAEYHSGNEAYGRSANAFISGIESGQSIMARKQAMRLREEQADQQRVEFQAKLPAIQAAVFADMASAKASVENAALIEQFRGKAAMESKELNDAYLQAIQLPSFEDQARALSALQPRVAYMETLPEYKGFVTAVNNATVRAHGSALVDRQLNNNLERETLKQQFQGEKMQFQSELQAKAKQESDTLIRERDQARFDAQQSRLDQTGQTAYNKKRGEEMAALVADTQSRVPQHYSTLEQTARARAALANDAEQGRGRGAVLATMQAINSFIPGTFDTANAEVLKNTYAEMALAAAAKMKGQGQITEPERRLLADTTAQFGNSPEGAKYIMDFMDAVAKREIKRAEYYSELEEDGQMVTGKRTTDFYRQNPVTKFLDSGTTQDATTPRIDLSKPLVIKSITPVP